MRRIIYLLLVACCIFSCSKDDSITNAYPELLVGDWVCNNPVTGSCEKVSYLSNMRLYCSICRVNPYLNLDNATGNYFFLPGNDKATLSYTNVLGSMTIVDVEFEYVKKYEYRAVYYSDDGSYGGVFNYNKIVKAIEINIGEKKSINYGSIISDVEIYGYSVSDGTKISVNSSTGEISAGNMQGLSYVYIETDEGKAAVEVRIKDPNNLIPDFSEALIMNLQQMTETWGIYSQEYSNVIFFPILGNDYAKTAKVYFKENKQVDVVEVDLKTYGSTSATEKAIHEFLSSKYTYQNKDDGYYLYFDFSRLHILPMAVAYFAEYNVIQYIRIEY